MTTIYRCDSCGRMTGARKLPNGWQIGTRVREDEYLGLSHRCEVCGERALAWGAAGEFSARSENAAAGVSKVSEPATTTPARRKRR